MRIHRGADDAEVPADDEHFTGQVWMTPLFEADGPGGMNVVRVRFAPSARTHWHSHPDGQMLLVLEGRGRIQSDGGRLMGMEAGDAIFVSSSELHWHGADPDSRMTHVSVTGVGGTVWNGPAVIDAEYGSTVTDSG